MKRLLSILALCLGLVANCWATNLTGSLPSSSLSTTAFSFDIIITNNDSTASAPLRVELWAFSTPYAGGQLDGGYRACLCDDQLFGGYPLAGGGVRTETSTPVAYAHPPAGTYYFTLFVTEQTGATTDDGYSPRLAWNFQTPLTFGSAPPAAIVPTEGMWWDPNESGTGYAVDVKHGVLVMTVYSYNTNGTPQWYLFIGTLVNNTTSGPLLKFANGNCMSCSYQPPQAVGNDGNITVTFDAFNSATLVMPNGRTLNIVPQDF